MCLCVFARDIPVIILVSNDLRHWLGLEFLVRALCWLAVWFACLLAGVLWPHCLFDVIFVIYYRALLALCLNSPISLDCNTDSISFFFLFVCMLLCFLRGHESYLIMRCLFFLVVALDTISLPFHCSERSRLTFCHGGPFQSHPSDRCVHCLTVAIISMTRRTHTEQVMLYAPAFVPFALLLPPFRTLSFFLLPFWSFFWTSSRHSLRTPLLTPNLPGFHPRVFILSSLVSQHLEIYAISFRLWRGQKEVSQLVSPCCFCTSGQRSSSCHYMELPRLSWSVVSALAAIPWALVSLCEEGRVSSL